MAEEDLFQKRELEEWTKTDDTGQIVFVPSEGELCARILNHDKEAESDDN